MAFPDPPVVFLHGTSAFLSGDVIPQFRRVRVSSSIPVSGKAGSEDRCTPGHDVSQVLGPQVSPYFG